MNNTYKTLRVSPMIPSFDVPATATFFIELFGFKTFRDDGNYRILYKDDCTIHIERAGTDIGEMEFYLEVDDINGLWANMGGRLGDIKVRPPFDRDYGMREFHVIVPHTKTLMFVGQVIIQ